VRTLEGRYGDHQLAYRAQLKARTVLIGETSHELAAAAVEQLAHRALVGLPVDNAFIYGVRDREIKQHLLMGGDRSMNEALNQALKLEAAKAAAGQPARLRKVTTATTGTRPQPAERQRNERPVCWQCGNAGHVNRTVCANK
jgi:hypothetical protein